jgi:hypothetical protein
VTSHYESKHSSVVCTTSRGRIKNIDDEIHIYLAVDGKYKQNAGPYPMPEESSTHSSACFYNIYFNIISSYVVGSLKFSFSFTVPYQNFVRIYLLSYAIPIVCPLILLP